MRVMGRESDGTNQLFALDQSELAQTVKPAAAQVTGNALDNVGTGAATKHQHRPMQPGADSFSAFGYTVRVEAITVGEAAPGSNQFQRIARHIIRVLVCL